MTNMRSGSILQHSSDGPLVPARAYIEAGGAASEPEPLGIDVREIARILRRHLRLIALTTALLVAAALLFVAIVTPRYTATATVLIDPRRATVVDSSNPSPVLSNFGTDDASIESQVSLTQSLSVMQRVVDSLKLAQEDRKSTRLNSSHLAVSRMPSSA